MCCIFTLFAECLYITCLQQQREFHFLLHLFDSFGFWFFPLVYFCSTGCLTRIILALSYKYAHFLLSQIYPISCFKVSRRKSCSARATQNCHLQGDFGLFDTIPEQSISYWVVASTNLIHIFENCTHGFLSVVVSFSLFCRTHHITWMIWVHRSVQQRKSYYFFPVYKIVVVCSTLSRIVITFTSNHKQINENICI